MNRIEYCGHTIEIKPFAFSHEGPSVAFPSLYDCFVDGLRRSSGFLQADDAELYGRSVVDEGVAAWSPGPSSPPDRLRPAGTSPGDCTWV